MHGDCAQTPAKTTPFACNVGSGRRRCRRAHGRIRLRATTHVAIQRASSKPARADRGLIPRSISHLFAAFKARTDAVHAVHVSYMELYNGQAFDLLDPSREITEMADLPRVSILEDEEGRYHMRGLSLHPCAPPKRLPPACVPPAGM